MKKQFIPSVIVLLLIAVLVVGCGCSNQSNTSELDQLSQAQTIAAQTLAALEVADSGHDAEALDETTPTPESTQTPTPAITPTPTITLTPTLSVPMVQVSMDTNCRTGPGKVYDWIGALLVGEEAEVVARSADSQYWVINNPDYSGNTCWLWGNYATVKGPTEDLPVWTPPPTPTPAPNWAGTWTVWIGSVGGALYDGQMTFNVSGNDFSASGTVHGIQFTLIGTVNSDRTKVSGTWTASSEDGPFAFYWVGVNQFNGYWKDNSDPYAWCGARDGAGQPSPCLAP